MATTENIKEILEKCTTNYNDLVKNKKVDKVIGRDNELKQIEQVLTRRKKNNVILVGDGGVGKTSILYALTEKIVSGECTTSLLGKEVIEIDLPSVVANSKFRGEFEMKIKALIAHFKSKGNVIAFIDEIHTLVGSGSSGNDNIDGANILKPHLSDGSIQLIGATTYKEYNKSIGKDSALERRFQKLIISEPTKADTINILKKSAKVYEEHHKVIYSDAVLEDIVNLSNRYITSRHQPDKSIDVMDEIGSRIRINKSYEKPEELVKLEERLEFIIDSKDKSIIQKEYSNAKVYLEEEKQLIEDIQQAKLNKKNDKSDKVKINITLENVCEVVSIISGIPIENIRKQDNLSDEISNMEKYLNDKVIGQEEAIKDIVKSIQKTKLGLKKDDKPASFMFLGSSGCGKTLLAKELTKYLFGDTKHLVRINMNEYSDKMSSSRLIGSPPGYVGHGEGGQLTRIIKDKPYAIILLDEIEKAHPDIMDIFLQVLDEGQLTDSEGVTYNFKNTMIILTSNIGTRKLKDEGKGIGFNTSNGNGKPRKDLLMKELEKALKPEVLNRIGSTIVFNELPKENLYSILDLYIADLKERMNELNYDISVTDNVRDEVIKRGTNGTYGARLIERIFNELVEDKISDALIGGVKVGSLLTVDFINGEAVVTDKKATKSKK